MSLADVQSSLPRLRIAPLTERWDGTRVGAMKNRFPSDRRATWRERFLAIARQADVAGERVREAVEVDGLRPRRRVFPSKSALRVRLASLSTH